jgi:hypothetical protein
MILDLFLNDRQWKISLFNRSFIIINGTKIDSYEDEYDYEDDEY